MKITAKFKYTWCWSINWNRPESYIVWLLIKPRNYKNVRIHNICERHIKYYKELRDNCSVYEE
jgi:hypothetical protein